MATTARENKELVQRFIGEANDRNCDQVAELLTADYTRHDPDAPEDERGFERFVESLQQLHEALPDSEVHVGETVAEDDLVAFEGNTKRRVQKDATDGEESRDASHAPMRVDNGASIEIWLHADRLGLLRHLGAVEPVDP